MEERESSGSGAALPDGVRRPSGGRLAWMAIVVLSKSSR